ncbi:MAG: T9SS type A sorting domain-containing protein, partial [Saprospiraceae bacterium]|nr:T9SS type A sorting domain-containing protein [Saprospiraceae bacterium]
LSSGTAYYGVAEWGKEQVVAGINRTQQTVAFRLDPINEPVTCHLQLAGQLVSGHKTFWFCMWVLGKQDYTSGRPDFPVMANAPKNGMPAMFIISVALHPDTLGGKRIPATNWFHGGGGSAVDHTANSTRHFNITPEKGILVSHNDDFPRLITDGDSVLMVSSRSKWFGWSKKHDPFDPEYVVTTGDTIINYTQRRIIWINNWLVKNYRVDPDHIALQGYSMGSAGASALAKAYPDYFSSICAFNNGFRGTEESDPETIHGTIAENLPTNLKGPDGEVIHMNQVWDMTTPISKSRDLPLFRTWAGKNDNNNRMHWAPDLIKQYRKADSLAYGMQISWDERLHVYETLGMHWIHGYSDTAQTYRDNLAYQEYFSNRQSYPAFYNHRLYPNNNDPGSGSPGINQGDGDNWGTWGGWHNWDLQEITDETDRWEVTAWLTGEAAYANDICPHQSLTSDLAIRRPQQFNPEPGSAVKWYVIDLSRDDTLQQGNARVDANGLVHASGITLYRDPRRVRIQFVSGSLTSVHRPLSDWEASKWRLGQNYPNPFHTSTTIEFQANGNEAVKLVIYDYLGQKVKDLINERTPAGPHTAVWDGTDDKGKRLSTGLYFFQLQIGSYTITKKCLLLR